MHAMLVPSFGLAPHTAMMIYIIIGFAVFALVMGRRIKLIPGLTQGVVEIVVEGFFQLADESMGHKGRKYLPYILTFALFILASNAMGLIPGLLPPTANLNSTLGLAVIVFLITHIVGFKEHGVKYIKHFIGPVWWMAPLMLPIELIGHFARPVSLSLRLFGNIMGHEQIVGVLIMLMPLAYPILALSTVLGVVVVLLQTFIFCLLSMMYIGGALEESH